MKSPVFFNAHHAPIGANASFTLGCPGPKGGLGLELPGPADEQVYIGLETRGGGRFEALPFFTETEDESKRFDVEGGTPERKVVFSFPDKAIRREFGLTADTWRAGDLTFTIHSPVMPMPDPAKTKSAAMADAVLPAVLCELTIDNRKGKKPRRAFFGYGGSHRHSSMRRLDDTSNGRLKGVGQGTRTAIVTDHREACSGQAFTIDRLLLEPLADNYTFMLGPVGAIMVNTAPGTLATYRFAVCFYQGGQATAGLDTHYYYTRHFKSIEAVATHALRHFGRLKKRWQTASGKLAMDHLSPEQRFMLIHAIRSYYGSTQFMEADKEPFWIVNEGEYRMMNTFDLTVDQLFFEMELNPWTVRNELDWFIKRYSYWDRVRFPGEKKTYPGGLTFTHDMGIANVFSRPSYSAYEQFGLHGCFSHMTHEELVNWVCCALVYAHKSRDTAWIKKNLSIFTDCLTSMMNRDHPKDSQRNGVMALDSDRCKGGGEITTYDSIDPSLGQARNNLYMAVKCWGAYLGLAAFFKRQGNLPLAGKAMLQARRAAATILSQQRPDGTFPAVLFEGVEAKILPAVEGLVFPWMLGLKHAVSYEDEYGELIRALRTHFVTAVKSGACVFPDGGWRISSSSDNAWLSKLYLCQFIARHILGISAKELPYAKADQAHMQWLLHPESRYYAWSDQIIKGIARGSKYYPRGVTAILWTKEK